MYSGFCSSESLRSLKSRRGLEVEFTLDPGVWIDSGVCGLDSPRSMEVGVSPESVFTPTCRLELLRSLESRVTL